MIVPSPRPAAAALIALLVSTGAMADDECLKGSWEGKLGASTVTLEFRADIDSDGAVGRYYYDRRPADLLLAIDADDPEHWQERDGAGRVTGRWIFSCSDDQLGGTWQSPDGHRTLSLAASRAADFDRRRLDALAPVASPRKDAQSHAYETLSIPGLPDVAALRLPGSTPGVVRINAELMAFLRDNVGQALECSSFGRLRGSDWSHHAGMEVVAWFDDAVSLRLSAGGYCGGAHPYEDTGYRTFRLADGEPFHPSVWLSGEHSTKIEPDSPLGAELKRRYLAEHDDLSECTDVLDFFTDAVALDPAGLRFPSSAPYVSRPCEDDVVIEFDALRPFLSDSGRQAIARLHGSATPPPH